MCKYGDYEGVKKAISQIYPDEIDYDHGLSWTVATRVKFDWDTKKDKGKQFEVAKLMVEKGAGDNYPIGVLNGACKNGDLGILVMITSRTLFIPSDCVHALHLACMYGHLPLVKFMVNWGRFSEGNFLDFLHLSLSYKQDDVSRFLLGHHRYSVTTKGFWESLVARSRISNIPYEKIPILLDFGMPISSTVYPYKPRTILSAINHLKKLDIRSSLSFYLIDDLLGVVMGYSLWVT